MKRSSVFLMIFIINSIIVGQNIDSSSVKYFNSIEEKLYVQKKKIVGLESELDSLIHEFNKLDIILKTQNKINIKQKAELITLRNIIELQKNKLDSLENTINLNKVNIKTISKELGTKIQQTETKTIEQITRLDHSLSKNQLYWIIVSLMLLLLVVIIYILLRKKIVIDKTDIENKLITTRKALEEETIKIDSKLIELMDSQLKLMKEERKTQPKADAEPDHSLALKVADEIIRMQKNIARMDENTKGIKPLLKGIERIKANFAANGYEMPDLLGKEFDERMIGVKIINVLFDENISKGKKIITKVIKPQVNFNGKLIQQAQVEISQNF